VVCLVAAIVVAFVGFLENVDWQTRLRCYSGVSTTDEECHYCSADEEHNCCIAALGNTVEQGLHRTADVEDPYHSCAEEHSELGTAVVD